ncbi:30S ribosome-binding factor RbfA [Neptunicoccus cionae]|uniref:Ribosome-binding factor A n=2 Tax=Neptunicoccus cionae TaxID=2035344 RepID=A0A916QQR7_9RHOB|nr:30S ribosome-binding factor RbfA [Amylibacter cionae]GGA04940.1 ribosome-binding factor A [Amylibacter cionae]
MAKRTQDSSAGPSQRQLRVGELIRRSLAETLSRGDIHDPDLAHVSITVGEVRPTPDLRKAVVHVLPLGGVNADLVIEALNKNTYELRRSINKNLDLKYSPELKFVYDRTFDQMDETRRLLEQSSVKQDLDKDES